MGKYNDLYKNLIRFIVNPDDQYMGPAQNQDPGRYADAQGAKRIGQMEGRDFRARAYYDKTGKYITEYKEGATIGWGHLIESRAEFEKYKNGITEREAIRLKQQDLKEAEEKVRKHIKVPITQDMCNALVFRVYNGGEGALTARYHSTSLHERSGI